MAVSAGLARASPSGGANVFEGVRRAGEATLAVSTGRARASASGGADGDKGVRRAGEVTLAVSACSSACTASATANGAHAGGRGSALRAAATDAVWRGAGRAAAGGAGTDDPRAVSRAVASVASSPPLAAACPARSPPRPAHLVSSAAWWPVPACDGRTLDGAGRALRVERLPGRAAAAADGVAGGGGVLGAGRRRGRRSVPSALRDMDRGRENSADRERGSRCRGVLLATAGDGGFSSGCRDASDCGSDADDGSGSGGTGGGASGAERFASTSDAGGRSGAARGPSTTAAKWVAAATSVGGTAEGGISTRLPLLSPDVDARRCDARGGFVPSAPGGNAVQGTSALPFSPGGASTGGGAGGARSARTPPTLPSRTAGVVAVRGGTSEALVDGRRRGDCDIRRTVRRDFRWVLDGGAQSCAPGVVGLGPGELAGASDKSASPPTDATTAAATVLCAAAGATNSGSCTRGGRGSRSSFGTLSTPGEVGVPRGSRLSDAAGRVSAATGTAVRATAGRSDRPCACDRTGGTRPAAPPFPAETPSTGRLRKLASMPPPLPCRNGGGGDTGGVDEGASAGPDRQRLARSDRDAERSSLLRRWARTGVCVGTERGRGRALNDAPWPPLPPPSPPGCRTSWMAGSATRAELPRRRRGVSSVAPGGGPTEGPVEPCGVCGVAPLSEGDGAAAEATRPPLPLTAARKRRRADGPCRPPPPPSNPEEGAAARSGERNVASERERPRWNHEGGAAEAVVEPAAAGEACDRPGRGGADVCGGTRAARSAGGGGFPAGGGGRGGGSVLGDCASPAAVVAPAFGATAAAGAPAPDDGGCCSAGGRRCSQVVEPLRWPCRPGASSGVRSGGWGGDGGGGERPDGCGDGCAAPDNGAATGAAAAAARSRPTTPPRTRDGSQLAVNARRSVPTPPAGAARPRRPVDVPAAGAAASPRSASAAPPVTCPAAARSALVRAAGASAAAGGGVSRPLPPPPASCDGRRSVAAKLTADGRGSAPPLAPASSCDVSVHRDGVAAVLPDPLVSVTSESGTPRSASKSAAGAAPPVAPDAPGRILRAGDRRHRRVSDE